MVDKDGNILTKSVTVASKEQSPFPVPEENIADKNENTDTEIPGESLEKLNTRSVGTSFSWSAKAVLALYDGNDEVTQDSLVPSAEGNGDIVIEITSNEKAKISGVPKPKAGSVAYVIKATYTGDYGLSGTSLS